MHLNGLIHQSTHVSVAHVQAGAGVSAGTCVRVPEHAHGAERCRRSPVEQEEGGQLLSSLGLGDY